MTTRAKKRDGPPRAQPVLYKGIRYNAETQAEKTWGSDPPPAVTTVFLVASDAETDAELWRVKLYDVHYAPEMERDKQDIYVTGLGLNLWRTKLNAVDEKGRKYSVDLKSHAMAA